MSIKNNHNRRVTFDAGDELGDKIDKLTVMIGKLAARDRDQVGSLNPKFTKVEEDKIEKGMLDVIMITKTTKVGIGQIVETGETSTGEIIEIDQGMNKTIEVDILQEMQEHIKILEDRIVEGDDSYGRSRDRNRSRERSFSGNFSNRRNNRSTNTNRSRLGLRASTNRERIRYYKCREYDHFMKDCPSFEEQRESEQLQQMLNLDKEQTSMSTNTHDSLNTINSLENLRQYHLNLQKMRMTPPHFAS